MHQVTGGAAVFDLFVKIQTLSLQYSTYIVYSRIKYALEYTVNMKQCKIRHTSIGNFHMFSLLFMSQHVYSSGTTVTVENVI